MVAADPADGLPGPGRGPVPAGAGQPSCTGGSMNQATSGRETAEPLPGATAWRSPLTERKYRTAGRALLADFAREGGTPDGLAAWFVRRARARRWVPATFFWYRRALARTLEAALETSRPARMPPGDVPAQDLLRELAALPLPPGLPRSSLRGPARRSKAMPPGPLCRLRAFLAAGRGRHDALAAQWLEAQRLTGLRPSEWAHARWIEAHDREGRPCGVLEVRNGKVNALLRRGNGPLRHLVFRGPLLPRRRASLGAFLAGLHLAMRRQGNILLRPAPPAAGPQRRKALERVYNTVRRRIRTANLALWGPAGWDGRGHTITLYSGRHQFAADAKSAGENGLPRAVLAALMGHASTVSARHYAGRATGSRRPPQALPCALQAEVAGVRPPGQGPGATAREAAPSSRAPGSPAPLRGTPDAAAPA